MLLWLALVQMRFTSLLVILKKIFTPIFGELLDFFAKNTMQKESIHLDLWLKSYSCLKLSGKYINLNLSKTN